jgi:hypothetical protein
MSLGIKHNYITRSASDTVTDTTTETAFSKTVSVYKESLRVGDFFQGSACVTAPTTNSTDTLTLKVYLGPTSDPKTGILVCDQTAIDVANDAVIKLDFSVSCDAIGAGSTAKFSGGGVSYANAATAVSKTRAFALGTDAQVSTYEDLVFAVCATWSAQSASDIARLDSFHVIKHPANPSA